MKFYIIALCLVLIAVCGVFVYYVDSTQAKIIAISDNQTKLQANFDTLAKEYVKLAQPKMFKNEEDLKTWLNSSETKTITGYMALAQSQGAFMQVWPAWKLSDRYAGVDTSEGWQDSKARITGMKYALLTLVDKKTYIIDVDTKQIIMLDPETKDGKW